MGQMLRARAYEMALLGEQDNCDAALSHVLEGCRELGPDLEERLQKNPGTRQRQGVKISLGGPGRERALRDLCAKGLFGCQ